MSAVFSDRFDVHGDGPNQKHFECPDPAWCACECLACKRAWEEAGRPSPNTRPRENRKNNVADFDSEATLPGGVPRVAAALISETQNNSPSVDNARILAARLHEIREAAKDLTGGSIAEVRKHLDMLANGIDGALAAGQFGLAPVMVDIVRSMLEISVIRVNEAIICGTKPQEKFEAIAKAISELIPPSRDGEHVLVAGSGGIDEPAHVEDPSQLLGMETPQLTPVLEPSSVSSPATETSSESSAFGISILRIEPEARAIAKYLESVPEEERLSAGQRAACLLGAFNVKKDDASSFIGEFFEEARIAEDVAGKAFNLGFDIGSRKKLDTDRRRREFAKSIGIELPE